VLPPKPGEVFYRLQQARKIWQPQSGTDSGLPGGLEAAQVRKT
jgi:hypothetical protein